MKNIGKRLKSLREKYKFSLEGMAQKIKSSAGAILRYENNERKINSASLIKLSNLYNVSPKYILHVINEDSSNLESSIYIVFLIMKLQILRKKRNCSIRFKMPFLKKSSNKIHLIYINKSENTCLENRLLN